MCVISDLRRLCFAARSVESSFLSRKFSFPAGSASIDVTKPEIARLLKQVGRRSVSYPFFFYQASAPEHTSVFLTVTFQIRLMNDFQKEVTGFWIRHPEK